ncbi:TetR/AcrR family transcriptional regulator [Nocardia sp. NPDC052316]|uniref:TetR/AcrR family transcriptional regulator n=1 Tax=Nocardia sp. NPDC052316 TaxID=3364329 RepID=UPI0037CC2D4A
MSDVHSDCSSGVLPKGPHRLGRDAVEESQRTRMFDAIIAIVAEKGYRATTVADVIGSAKVSRRTFYEHFADKDACFSAAFSSGMNELLVEVVTATAAGGDRDQRIEGGHRALCVALAKRPALATVFLVCAPQAGADVRAKYERYLAGTVSLLRQLVSEGRKKHPELPPELSEHAARAIVGAVVSLLTSHLLTHGADRLPDLVPTLLAVVHALLLADVPPPSMQASDSSTGPSAWATSARRCRD